MQIAIYLMAVFKKQQCRGSLCFDMIQSETNPGVIEIGDSCIYTNRTMKPYTRFMLHSWTEGTSRLSWRGKSRAVGRSNLITLHDLEP